MGLELNLNMRLDVSLIKSVLTIYDELLTNGITLVYLGEFSHEITKMFTSMAEDDMESSGEDKTTVRRVYHVMVETLQNMNKHSDEFSDIGNIGKGMFLIGRKEDCYYVITSNKVSKEKKENLEKTLQLINSSTKDELREMFKKQIKEGSLSDKGGAGLGLIDMARKTTGKLHHHFLPIDDQSYFFLLNVEIQTTKIKEMHSA